MNLIFLFFETRHISGWVMNLESGWSGWSDSSGSWFTFGSGETRSAWLSRWSRSTRLTWKALLSYRSCASSECNVRIFKPGDVKQRQVDFNLPGSPISPMLPLSPRGPGPPGLPGKPGSPLAPAPKQKQHVRTLTSSLCITSEGVFVPALSQTWWSGKSRASVWPRQSWVARETGDSFLTWSTRYTCKTKHTNIACLLFYHQSFRCWCFVQRLIKARVFSALPGRPASPFNPFIAIGCRLAPGGPWTPGSPLSPLPPGLPGVPSLPENPGSPKEEKDTLVIIISSPRSFYSVSV